METMFNDVERMETMWDEKNQIHSIDIVVFGDARELSLVLQQQFPHATVTVRVPMVGNES